MKAGLLVVTALVALCVAPARQAQTPEPTDAFVTVRVAVEQADGRPETGIRAEDFEILLDGEPQPIVRVTADPPPLRIALLIDVTTRPRLPGRVMRTAVEQFAKALRADDSARIWRIGGGITAGPPFTSDSRALFDAARRAIDPPAAETSGPSPIWDAVVEAVTALGTEAGRRAILLITDGRATGNRHSLLEAIERASAADVSVNILAPEASRTFMSESHVVTVHPERMSEALAANTGGRFVNYATGRPAPGELLNRVLEGLRHEYALAIRRPPGDAPRLIEVRVRRPGLTMRARRVL